MPSPNQSSRVVDDNGFMSVKGCPISSHGIFEYTAEQVGLDGDPDRIVNVYRPESEISDPEAIASFQILPLVDEHDLLSGFEEDEDVMSPEEKGVDGVLSGVVYDAPWLKGDVKVFTRRMKRAIDSGKVELSLGYGCDFILKSGTYQGQPYEVVQTNMRGNHLALVEAARVEGAKVLDSKIAFDCVSTKKPIDNRSIAMLKGKKGGKYAPRRHVGDSSAVERLKQLLPALEQFLNEEAQEPEHQEGADPEVQAEGTESVDNLEGGVPESESEEQVASGADVNLETLIGQVEAILAELKGAPAADSEEGFEDPVAHDEEEADCNDSLDPEVKATAADEATEEANGKASPGPAKGNFAADAAAVRRSVYKDIAAKNALYERVSPVIGAFDHALMDHAQMADYAAKKLKLNAPKGSAVYALDSYLKGVEKAKANVVQAKVGDSDGFGNFDPIDQYLNKGGK